MNIEVGKTYVARNGKHWDIIARMNPNETFQFVGQCGSQVSGFRADGTYAYEKCEVSSDLIREYREPVTHRRWVVLWKLKYGADVYSSGYSTREMALTQKGRISEPVEIIGIEPQE